MFVEAITAFHVFGSLLAAWALTVTAFGLLREGFPTSTRQARLVGTISVLLVVGSISSGIIVGALEGNQKGTSEAAAKPAPKAPPSGGGGGATTLQLAASNTALKFDKSSLQAKAGPVRIDMKNPSQVPHNVSIEGKGVDQGGKTVQGGGTSTVTAKLKPGTYTFYCSVDGHRQAGMEGKLTVK